MIDERPNQSYIGLVTCNLAISNHLEPAMLSTADIVEVVLSVMALLGSFLGNSLLFYVLYITKSLRRSASPNLILNSAIIDLLNALINIHLALDYLIFQTGNLDNSVAPPFVNSMITFFLLLTLHSTLTLMGDKVLILKYTTFYRNHLTVKKARLVCLAIWLSATVFTLVSYGLRHLQSSNNYTTLIQYLTAHHRGNGKFSVFAMTFAVFLLLLLVCSITYRALRAVPKKRIEVETTRQDDTTDEERAKDLRQRAQMEKYSYACRTVLTVLIVYIISFLPILFNSLLRILNVTPLAYNKEQAFIPLFCSQFGAVFNPFIFIFRSKNYRKVALRLLRRLKCCHISISRIEPSNLHHSNRGLSRSNSTQL